MDHYKISDWVVYKNNQIIAFNKPPTLPVQPDKTETKSLLDLGEIYCKSKIQVLHRIDRPASGIVLFGKTPAATRSLNAQFQERSVKKKYLAVVKTPPPSKQGELIHYLQKNAKYNKAYCHEAPKKGAKKAILEYQLIASSDNYHLLSIDLKTGRHHQIRAQLAAIGSPIKGDVKYGARRGNKDRSIHLHAWKLDFSHPVTSEKICLTAAVPEDVVWQAFKKDLLKRIT